LLFFISYYTCIQDRPVIVHSTFVYLSKVTIYIPIGFWHYNLCV